MPCDKKPREQNPAVRAQPAPSAHSERQDPRMDAPTHLPAASLTHRAPSCIQQCPGNGSGCSFSLPLPPHSMATGCCPSTSLVLEFTSSLRISGEICGWLWNLSSSSKASFCSEERSSL